MAGRKSKYSPEFRDQAVIRTLSGSFSVKEVAESLGVSIFMIRQWKAEYLKRNTSDSPPTDKQLKESEELRRLRKVVASLREQNAVLKKFASMLSREQYPE